MRSQRLTAALIVSAAMAAVSAIRPTPCGAQTRLASLEELRRALGEGDAISVAAADGELLTGRLTRIGNHEIDVRLRDRRSRHDRRRTVTVPLDAIRWLERRRDSPRNGVAIGAGVGAALGAAMFIYATAVDRNEIDEWGPAYAGATAVFTAVGALIGWRIDGAMSKPYVRFDGSAAGRRAVAIQPLYSHRGGFGVAVSFFP